MTSRIAAVIGQPVEHSLSPAIHNAAFAASGRVGEYVAIECGEREVSTLMKSIRAEGLVGLSVTMPLKEAVIDTLDSLHVTASLLNAVNCISFTDGRAVGYNTDGDGCCDALTEQGGAVIEGSTAVVLGAGGTARSCDDFLRAGGAERMQDARLDLHERGVGERIEAARAGQRHLDVVPGIIRIEFHRDIGAELDAVPGGDGGIAALVDGAVQIA